MVQVYVGHAQRFAHEEQLLALQAVQIDVVFPSLIAFVEATNALEYFLEGLVLELLELPWEVKVVLRLQRVESAQSLFEVLQHDVLIRSLLHLYLLREELLLLRRTS